MSTYPDRSRSEFFCLFRASRFLSFLFRFWTLLTFGGFRLFPTFSAVTFGAFFSLLVIFSSSSESSSFSLEHFSSAIFSSIFFIRELRRRFGVSIDSSSTTGGGRGRRDPFFGTFCLATDSAGSSSETFPASGSVLCESPDSSEMFSKKSA